MSYVKFRFWGPLLLVFGIIGSTEAQTIFYEDFENTADDTFQTTTTNIAGAPEWEYTNDNSGVGRLRFYADNGAYAKSGTRAASMDVSTPLSTAKNQLTATVSALSGYSTADDIMLNFSVLSHGDDQTNQDEIQVRGSSGDVFVTLVNLDTAGLIPGQYITVQNVNISNVLSNNGQSFSSSFQLRLIQEDNYPISSDSLEDGLTFDDIEVWKKSNDDIGVAAINTPAPAQRQFTYNGLTSNQSITVTVQNYGAQAQSDVPIVFEVDNTTKRDTIPSIAAGATQTFTSSVTFDMNLDQTYNLNVWTELANDQNTANDSIRNYTARHISNYPLELSFVESFEEASVDSLTDDRYGIPGISEWDYENTQPDSGRVRFKESRFAYHMSGAATLDKNSFTGSSTDQTNYLTLTLNLRWYENNAQFYLSFYYLSHGDDPHANDRVWVRTYDKSASDTSWVQIYDLTASSTPGSYQKASMLDITGTLISSGQLDTTTDAPMSTSLQIRFGQRDNLLAYDTSTANGYTFDSIAVWTPDTTSFTGVKMAQNDLKSRLTVYPNPTQKYVNVELKRQGKSKSPTTLTVYNLNGKVVEHRALEQGQTRTRLSLGGYAPGVYFVEAVTANGRMVRKLIKR